MSQIDHILFSPVTSLVPLQMSANWTKVRSDHKLLACCVKLSKITALQNCNRQTPLSGISTINSELSVKDLKWNVNNLSNRRHIRLIFNLKWDLLKKLK